MKKAEILIAMCILGLSSCTLPKESRLLKKNTKDWRSSSIVLQGYADSPFSGTFLTLRENGKFEHLSSGLFQSYQAGNWTYRQDTITLFYVDEKQTFRKRQTVIMDKKSARLLFESENTLLPMRIITSKI
jgi:hypothetical protein